MAARKPRKTQTNVKKKVAPSRPVEPKETLPILEEDESMKEKPITKEYVINEDWD